MRLSNFCTKSENFENKNKKKNKNLYLTNKIDNETVAISTVSPVAEGVSSQAGIFRLKNSFKSLLSFNCQHIHKLNIDIFFVFGFQFISIQYLYIFI